VLKTNQVVGNASVVGGTEVSVPVTAAKPLTVTMQVDSHAGMKTQLKIDPNLQAPVQVGQKVGVLVVTAPEFPPLTVPVYATQSVNKIGLIGGLWQSIKHAIWKK
jgi:D-alanyl-D-alanine carboxypeptidase (penicillin-binding protein 5/6)